MLAFGRLFWAVAFVSALLVLVVLSVGPEEVPYIAHSDKLSHFLAYAATTTCAGLAFSVPRQRLLAAAATFIISVVLELVQAFVPGRLPDILDIGANGAGILLGLLISRVILYMADGMSARNAKGLPGWTSVRLGRSMSRPGAGD